MPQSLPNIYPALSYRDASAALDWLGRAFGFETMLAIRNDDGTIAHAEMRLGPGVIMLADAKPHLGWLSPLDLPAVNGSIYVVVDDPDAHYARAKAAGATIVREVNDTDYGSREYGAKDPEGHHWSFGTYRPGS